MTDTSHTAHQAPPRLRFSVAPDPSRLLRARERIRDYVRLHCTEQATVDDIVLAIEEACTNAIRHSGSPEEIEIVVAFDGDDLLVTVKDRGRGFEVESFDPEALPDPLLDHGRGLFLIARLTDGLELARDGGLEVRFRKRSALRPTPLGEIDRLLASASHGPHSLAGRARAMLDEIDEGFAALDWDYRYAHVNPAACRLLELDEAQIIGRLPGELWPDFDDPRVKGAYRDAMELGRSSIIEYETAGHHWFEERLYPTTIGMSIYFRNIDERKRLEREREELAEAIELSEQRARRKLESILAPQSDLGELELGDLIDATTLQALMDDFHALVAIPMAILDATGRVLVGAGWQDICTQFHRAHPETARHCLESDTTLSGDLRQGEYRLYRCKNNMWDIATPVMVAGRLAGYVFAGQFFFDDEAVDRGSFAAQARRYGFDERQYLAALDRVPRLSRESVDRGMAFFVKLADTLSQLAHANISLARMVNERDQLAHDLQGQGERLRHVTDELQVQNEEIAGQAEELQAQNEELAAQSEEMQAQNEELAAQSEELQAQNEELATQGEELQAQAVDLQERSRLATALNVINRIVHSALEPEQIMQRALDEGAHALHVACGTIELCVPGGWLVRYQHGFGDGATGAVLTDDEAPNAVRARLTADAFATADMRGSPADVGFVARHALRSVLAMPLLNRDAVLGCLLFYDPAVRVFDGAEIDFARKLGATVSLALENARQREKLEQAAALRFARSLIEVSPDPLVTISPRGTITDVNAATELATGRAREQLIGSDFSEYFTEPDRARAGYERVLAEGQVRDYPLALRHSDGSVIDVEYNAALYRDDDGEVAGVFAAARDVTVRKRAELALRESEQRFRTVADLTYSWESWIDERRRFLYISPACESITGYRPEEFEAQPDLVAEIVHPEDRASFAAHRDRYHGESLDDTAETAFRIVRRDGAVRWIEHTCRPVFDQEGRFVGRRISNRDVTEQHRADEALRAASLHARSLIEASLDPLVTISAQGTITDVNQATVEVTGVARESLIATQFSDYFTEPDKARAGYERVFETGSVRDYPLAIRHTSGRLTEVLYNASLYRDQSGEVQGVFAAARDVTERNRAQAAASENARLYEAQRDLALTLQANFLHALPEIPGFRLAALSLPAGRDELVGGDFRDVIVRPDGTVVVLIGDVTGKGIRAAGFTETVRSAVRTLALISPSPDYILGNANRLILAEGAHQQLATALVVTIDPATGRAATASAGHPPAVRLCDGGCALVEPRFGLPLGALDRGYEAAGFALEPGEALVLYTDGLTEARRDGHMFGEQRLLDLLATVDGREPQRLIDTIEEAVVSFAGELKDDLQILAIRRTG